MSRTSVFRHGAAVGSGDSSDPPCPRAGVTVAACLIGLLALSIVTPRAAAQDLPELQRLFPRQAQHADYIIALDRSGTMTRYWPATKASLRAFVLAVPDSDHVSIISFSKTATNTQLIPRTLTPSARQSFLAELEQMPAPRPQPGDDSFNFTDLGRGLTKTVEEMNRPGSNRLQFVFLLTDFLHDPSDASPFQGTELTHPSWQGLVRQAAAVRDGKAIQCFAIILPVDGQAGRDINLARSVFGDIQVIQADEGTLTEWFRRQAEEVQRTKLHALARADIANGWTWTIAPESNLTALTLKSNLRNLPLNVNLTSATIDGRPCRLPGGRSLTIEPGGTTRFLLAPEPCPTGLPLWKWLVMPGGTQSRQVVLEGEGAITVGPERELARLSIEPRRSLDLPPRGTGAIRRCGAPLWLQAISGLAAVLLAGFIWRTWLAPVRPVRSFIRRVGLKGAAVSEMLDVPPGGHRSVLIGNIADAEVKSALPEPAFAVRLTSRKPRFPGLRPRRGVYAERVAGQVYVKGRQYDAKLRRWVDRELLLPESSAAAHPVSFQTRIIVSHQNDRIVLSLHS